MAYSYENDQKGIDEHIFRLSETSLTILNNEKLEDKLNVITVHCNPYHFKRRKFLSEQFREEMLKTPHVELYIVELAYDDDPFEVTDKNNKNHLQLRTSSSNMLWEKECLLNLGVKKLLPENWKAFAWVDGDVSFSRPDWASDALKILNGHRDIIQLFNVCLDLDKQGNTLTAFHSFAYQYET